MSDAQVVDLLLTRAYSAKSVLFAKNPYPSPAELNGVPDIGTNIPYSGAGDLFPSITGVVFILFAIAIAFRMSND
jgi:hypothetical protein